MSYFFCYDEELTLNGFLIYSFCFLLAGYAVVVTVTCLFKYRKKYHCT